MDTFLVLKPSGYNRRLCPGFPTKSCNLQISSNLMLYEDISLVLLHSSRSINRNFHYRILNFKMSHCWAVIIVIFHVVKVQTCRRMRFVGVFCSFLVPSRYVLPMDSLAELLIPIGHLFQLQYFFQSLSDSSAAWYFLVHNLQPLFPPPPPPP